MRLVLIIFAAMAASCTPYRVEYHTRPRYYDQATDQELPDEVRLKDGTVVRYSKPNSGAVQKTIDDDSEPFEIRSVAEDGTITLRNLTPDHVVSNLMTCIRNEEYDVVYQQILSKRARAIYEQDDGSEQSFVEFCKKNRRDIMVTLNRMSFGFTGQDVYLTPIGNGMSRAGFSPSISELFAFKHVEFSAEDGGIKLFRIY